MISRHNLPDERARPVAHVTCSIFGDHVEPGVWTKYFAIEPDISVVKGKPFNTPSGRISSHPGRTGVWGCSSRLAIQDKTLDAHIRYLISRLALPREDLPGLLEKNDATMEILCFWPNYSGDGAPAIDPQLVHIIETSGGTVTVDEYPQKHRIIGPDGKEKDVWI